MTPMLNSRKEINAYPHSAESQSLLVDKPLIHENNCWRISNIRADPIGYALGDN
jgi:hypothetical protein